MISKKKIAKPLVEQSLSGMGICAEAYRQQLDFLLIHLDVDLLTPLINKLAEAKDSKGMQQFEAMLRKSFNHFAAKKVELNQELLIKDIELNPELGVQLKKVLHQINTDQPTTRPRFK